METSTVDSFGHAALYYTTPESFLAGVLPYVHTGLDAGEPTVVAVPPPRIALVREALGADADRVTYLDMTEAGRNPNWLMPWVLLAFVGQHPGRAVRVVGEPVYVGRTPEETAACVQHEALINVAFAGQPVSILCPYDVAAMPDIVNYADRTHPVLVDDHGRRSSTRYTDPATVVALLNQPLPEPKRTSPPVTFDVLTLARARREVAEHAELAGLAPDRVRDLQLAVNEIATNAVTHVPDSAATLRTWVSGGRMICEVRGPGEISDLMAGRVVPDPDSPRGRGLLVANQLCDLVQTHTVPAGTVTRLHMRL